MPGVSDRGTRCDDSEEDEVIWRDGPAARAAAAEEDQATPPPPPEEPQRESAPVVVGRKAVACWHMQHKNYCQHGDACHFSHDPELLHAQAGAAAHGSGAPHKPFKTVICKSIHSQNTCYFRNNCTYAHSRSELLVWSHGGPRAAVANVTPSEAPPKQICRYINTPAGCHNGDQCKFSHAPPQVPTETAPGDGNRHPERFYKTTLCAHYNAERGGGCKSGEHCHFAHGAHELRKAVLTTVKGAANGSHTNAAHKDNGKGAAAAGGGSVNPLHKTVLCKHFTAGGQCKHGDRCTYAHGVKDLNRNASPPAPTNTAVCRFYATDSGCRSGDICMYAHGKGSDAGAPPGNGKRLYCRFYPTESGCKSGRGCSYIHAEPAPPYEYHSEMQKFHRPSMFKTVVCKHYGTLTGCKKGSQCNYAHDERMLEVPVQSERLPPPSPPPAKPSTPPDAPAAGATEVLPSSSSSPEGDTRELIRKAKAANKPLIEQVDGYMLIVAPINSIPSALSELNQNTS